MNNHPGVVASYFISCVQNVGGTACVIRGDMGTESMTLLHLFIRQLLKSCTPNDHLHTQRLVAHLMFSCTPNVMLHT